MNLSPYTIAKNCTDLNDVNTGIEEIKKYFKQCEKNKITPVKTSYGRLFLLMKKKELLTKKK